MATIIYIAISVNYYCAYIPSARSQKYSFDEVKGDIKVGIQSVTAEEAPVAFLLSDYSHQEKDKTEIRWYQGKCWKKSVKDDWQSHGGPKSITPEYLLDHLHPSLPYGHARSRDLVVKRYRKELEDYLVIDGEVWQQCGEPRYVINTFGLGHNHGGTGLFVEEFYNSNISHDYYFSALDGDKAVAEANRIAERRGDTNSVGKFEKMIEVLIPEAVTIRPEAEHGEGDPFINKINKVTEAAPDATTAGLLAMMVAAKEISK